MIDEKLMVRDIERRKAADLIYSSAVKTAPKAEEAPRRRIRTNRR